jgi:hypothetical protein
MIADASTAWRRNLASMGSPKISSNTSWKNTTKRKKIAAEAKEDWRRLSLSDIGYNLLIPAIEGKRRVQIRELGQAVAGEVARDGGP